MICLTLALLVAAKVAGAVVLDKLAPEKAAPDMGAGVSIALP